MRGEPALPSSPHSSHLPPPLLASDAGDGLGQDLIQHGQRAPPPQKSGIEKKRAASASSLPRPRKSKSSLPSAAVGAGRQRWPRSRSRLPHRAGATDRGQKRSNCIGIAFATISSSISSRPTTRSWLSRSGWRRSRATRTARGAAAKVREQKNSKCAGIAFTTVFLPNHMKLVKKVGVEVSVNTAAAWRRRKSPRATEVQQQQHQLRRGQQGKVISPLCHMTLAACGMEKQISVEAPEAVMVVIKKKFSGKSCASSARNRSDTRKLPKLKVDPLGYELYSDCTFGLKEDKKQRQNKTDTTNFFMLAGQREPPHDSAKPCSRTGIALRCCSSILPRSCWPSCRPPSPSSSSPSSTPRARSRSCR